MEMKIGVIKGDGIGPEIVDEAMKVLDQTAKVLGSFYFLHAASDGRSTN